MRSPNSILLFAIFVATSLSAAVPRRSVSHYQLEVRIDPPAAKMRVEGLWTTPSLDEPASNFRFLLSPLMQSLRISSVRCGAEPLHLSRASSHDDGGDRAWELEFRESCPAGRSLRLAFSYESDGKSAPQLRIRPDRGFAGSSGELWYPQRSFGERETARLTLDIPSRLKGIATGMLTAKSRRKDRTRLIFETRVPAKLSFAYGRYHEVMVAGPVPVRVLTFEEDRALNLKTDRLAQTLAPLTAAFGPAPFNELALVEIDFQSKVLGVGEYGMIFADVSKVREPYDLVYWAHEFGHQWWGNAVRPASGSEGASLLTEGLAQYGALYALDQVEGEAAADEYKAQGRGEDRRQSLMGYRALAESGQDRPLVRAPQKSQEEIILGHRLATSKGALLLDAFAQLIGRNEFHAILANFIATHRNEATSWAELEAAINRATDNRHAAQLRAWFTDPGVPEPLREPRD